MRLKSAWSYALPVPWRRCYTVCMDAQDSPPRRCPSCGGEQDVVRAAEVAVEKTVPPHGLDVALAPYETVPATAAVCFAICGLSILLAAVIGVTPGADGSVPVAVGCGFAGLGWWSIRRMRADAARTEPAVRHLHERAMYCPVCECVYFTSADLPAGLDCYTPVPVAEYRGTLWKACGRDRNS
jgi:hypothetical protein